MIPATFEEWVNCITNDCKIRLDTSFAAGRLSVLQDKNHKETKVFIQKYGETHWKNVISWYKQIAKTD